MENEKPVTKCICFDTTFAELKDSGLSSLDSIVYALGASSACGLCRAYIEAMLVTGDTEFEVFPVEEAPT